ncbi:hypothetical protein [Thalassoglobus polymorphus]|uniref:hypothetical protein n=1 Tax=Thalassoglobus polymorphus TaxID=2527994 RepID=UPI0011A1DF52|nr:hypothetical protein [Thalassoglobus polymorphus]
MASPKIKKQISIFLPISDWRILRQEAARLGVPITELCRRWICPEIAELHHRLPHRDESPT